MRFLKTLVLGAAVLALAGSARAHEDDDDEGGGGQYRATLVPHIVAPGAATQPTGRGRLKIESEDGGEVKLRIEGVSPDGVTPSPGPGSLIIVGAINGGTGPAPLPFDMMNGEGRLRTTLGLLPTEILRIDGVSATTPDPTMVPGLSLVSTLGGGSDDGDLSAARDGGGGDDSGFSTSLVDVDAAVSPGFDSAAGGHLELNAQGGGSYRVRLEGVVVDPAIAPPVAFDGTLDLMINGSCDGVVLAAPLTFPLVVVGGSVSQSGPLGLPTPCNVFEIGVISVSNGTAAAFAPGLGNAGTHDEDGEDDDDDHDGCPNDGDVCSGTPTPPTTASGCNLAQLCGCPGTKAALRSCLKTTRTQIRTRVKAVCAQSKKRCHKLARQLAVQQRQALRACR